MMKKRVHIATIAAFGFLATATHAADVKIARELHLSRPSTEVWHRVGEFCDID